MTYRLADADERAALDPAFGEGETTAIMREQWHEALGYYSTVVAVVHVDDAAHVLEALTAHAVQPGDMRGGGTDVTTKPTVAAQAMIELAESLGLNTARTNYGATDAVRIYVSTESPINDLIVTWGESGTSFWVDKIPGPLPLPASHASIRLRNMAAYLTD